MRRIVRSSSATRIVAGGSVIGVLRRLGGRGGREGEREDGAGPLGPVGGAEVAAVGQGDLAGDRQAQAGALGLGREERLEQVRQDLGRRAPARCRPRSPRPRRRAGSSRVVSRSTPPRGMAWRALVVRLRKTWSRAGGAIATGGRSGVEVELDPDPLRLGRARGQPGGLGDHGVQVAGGEVLGVGPRELEQPRRRSPRAGRPRRSGRRTTRRRARSRAARAGRSSGCRPAGCGPRGRRRPAACPGPPAARAGAARSGAGRARPPGGGRSAPGRRSGPGPGRSRPGPGRRPAGSPGASGRGRAGRPAGSSSRSRRRPGRRPRPAPSGWPPCSGGTSSTTKSTCVLADRGVDLDLDQVGLAGAAARPARAGRAASCGVGRRGSVGNAAPRNRLLVAEEVAPLDPLERAAGPRSASSASRRSSSSHSSRLQLVGPSRARSPGSSPPRAARASPGPVEHVAGRDPPPLARHDRGAGRPERRQRGDEQRDHRADLDLQRHSHRAPVHRRSSADRSSTSRSHRATARARASRPTAASPALDRGRRSRARRRSRAGRESPRGAGGFRPDRGLETGENRGISRRFRRSASAVR